MEGVRPGRIRAVTVQEGDMLVTAPVGDTDSTTIGTVIETISYPDGSLRWIVGNDWGEFIVPGPESPSSPASAFAWIDVPARNINP